MSEQGESLLQGSRRALRKARDFFALPREAKREYVRDRLGMPEPGLGVRDAIDAAVNWIGMAQDHSSTADGGVASYYSLVSGWSESYPETTGYIVPTLLDYASRFERDDVRDRARRMLDWLVSIQFPEGGFQGGTIGAQPLVPVTFNTGQILIGLAAGVREFGEIYERPMRAAADWLVGTQDPDGCWRSHPSPFTSGGEKSYETHVSWGLIEAHGLVPDRGYAAAALAQVGWALSQQRENGWFEQCSLSDPSKPLTHTLAYTLRGCLAALDLGADPRILEACVRTAEGFLGVMGPDGFIPGRLNSNWEGPNWSCLTGTAQIAHCWHLLFGITGQEKYRDASRLANSYIRRTIRLDGPMGARGGVKGSFPVNGGYCPYWYINWAAKFFVDSHLAELEDLAPVAQD